MDDEQPVYDFGEMSWGDTKALISVKDEFRSAGASGDVGKVIEVFAKIERYIAPLIVSMPRSWLVKRAPELIDFCSPGGFDHLKTNRFLDVMSAVIDHASEAQNTSKNLPKASSLPRHSRRK